MKVFTSGEAAALTGIPYDRLDNWARTGFIRPSIVRAEGKGSKRVYSFADLMVLRVVNTLRNMGIQKNRLEKVIYQLAKLNLESLPCRCYLIMIIAGDYDFEQILLTGDEQQLIDVLSSRSEAVFIVLDLTSIVNKLREKINQGDEMQSHPSPRYDAPRALEVVPGRGPVDKGVETEISAMLQEINREFLEEIKEAEERRRKRCEMATREILRRLLAEKQK